MRMKRRTMMRTLEEEDKNEEQDSDESDNESNQPVLPSSHGKHFCIGPGKQLMINSQEQESEQNEDSEEEEEDSNPLGTENSNQPATEV